MRGRFWPRNIPSKQKEVREKGDPHPPLAFGQLPSLELAKGTELQMNLDKFTFSRGMEPQLWHTKEENEI